MGIFDIFKKKKPAKVEAPREARVKKTEKEIATEKGEPWVGIISMDVDPENMHQGAFELDWNDKFVANLIRAGYQGKPEDTDAEIVLGGAYDGCRIQVGVGYYVVAAEDSNDGIVQIDGKGDLPSELNAVIAAQSL